MLTRIIAVSTLAIAPAALAQVNLSGVGTADNVIEAFVSTDDQTPGTLFMSGANWQQLFSGSIPLANPGTYYLHVRCTDQGPPAMFIGLFNLDSSLALFENGTQSLPTQPAFWRVSTTGFGDNLVVPTDLGPNGTGPWGNMVPLGPDARYLWSSQNGGVSYFTTTIRVLPTPGALVLAGAAGLVIARRRR